MKHNRAHGPEIGSRRFETTDKGNSFFHKETYKGRGDVLGMYKGMSIGILCCHSVCNKGASAMLQKLDAIFSTSAILHRM